MSAMTTFFHLPREDVVFSLILPHLETQETWALRLVCREFCRLCDEYFSTFCTSIDYKELAIEETKALRDRACISRALLASKRLKNINLCLCRRETWSATIGRASDLLMTTVWRLHNDCRLVTLSLVATDYSLVSLPSSGWGSLGERCSRSLRELHIEDSSPFDDECLWNLTRQCTSLVHLRLKSLPALRGVHLQKLVETSPHLTTLNVRNSEHLN